MITSYDILNVNADIIYGIKNQTKKTLLKSIDKVIDSGCTEIFIYPLYLQNNSILKNKDYCTNEEKYNLYFEARKYLIEKGYRQYSMRCFSKKSKNISKNCGFENILALGCGGRSYFNNLHFCSEYSSDNQEASATLLNFLKTDNFLDNQIGYLLDYEEIKRRYVIKNIFHVSGISEKEYFNIFNAELLSDFSILLTWIGSNYAKKENDYIKLTSEGLSLSDYLGMDLMSNKVRKVMTSEKEI